MYFGALAQQAQRWEMSSSSSSTDTTSSSSNNSSSKFTPSPEVAAASTNVMDIWVQASLQGLIQFVHEEMAAYRLYTVVPKLVDFIQDLTNWYVCALHNANTQTLLLQCANCRSRCERLSCSTAECHK
jgi:valyl-tRNA synthetase